MDVKIKRETKREGLLFVCDLQDAAKLAGVKRAKVVLGAPAVLASMDPLVANPDYIPQPARSTTGLLAAKKGGARVVHSAISREVLQAVFKGRNRVVYAWDVALRYGKKIKNGDDHLILCAFSNERATSVLVLVMRKKALVSIQAYSLSLPSSPDFEMDVHLLLERLRVKLPAALLHWLGPVQAPGSIEATMAAPAIWSGAPAQAVEGVNGPGLLTRFGAAIILVLLALMGAALAVIIPYEKYQASVRLLEVESQSLKGQFQFASDRLKLLRARQAFFDSVGRDQKRLKHFEGLLSRVASEARVQVISAKLLNKDAVEPTADQGRSADFELLVQVPRQGSATALAQSLPFLQELSQSTGMALRLATSDGHREIVNGDEPRRQYRIQGDFPSAE